MIMMAYSMKIRNLVSNIIRLFSMINQKSIYNTHMSNSENYFSLHCFNTNYCITACGM